jgi:DNA-directed RNA polymerase subunit RPC12/RpoP
MLSRTSRYEILRKIELNVGHPVSEAGLSPETRKAVDSLAMVQRNLFAIADILRGEKSRVESSPVLSFSHKVHKDKQMLVHEDEVKVLQGELDAKIAEVSARIANEDRAKVAANPEAQPEEAKAYVLKCPSCAATIPMPAGRFVKCPYCRSVISIQDMGDQIKSLIQSI